MQKYIKTNKFYIALWNLIWIFNKKLRNKHPIKYILIINLLYWLFYIYIQAT